VHTAARAKVGEEKQSFWFVSFCETTFTAVEVNKANVIFFISNMK
jgi:hypothetical protein